MKGNPNGEETTYHIEYGTKGDCAIPENECTSFPEPEILLGTLTFDAENQVELQGLETDTLYHYRVVMSNKKGTVTNETDHFFKTFGHTKLPPPCPNDLARQQTGATLLLDCRAYELVSAGNSGGYDVESNLVPGQTPYEGSRRPTTPRRPSTASTTGRSRACGQPDQQAGSTPTWRPAVIRLETNTSASPPTSPSSAPFLPRC